MSKGVKNFSNEFGLEGFYYEQASLGIPPSVQMFVNDKDSEPINKLSISQTIPIIGWVKYPGRDKISFESLNEYNLGDKVEVRLFYEGQRWCKMYYYTFSTVPKTNIFKGMITKKSFNSTGLTKGEVYSYECRSDMRGLGDKISIATNNKIEHILNKITVANAYVGTKYEVQSAGEYKLSKILSDLSEYASYKTGKHFIIELNDNTIELKDTTSDVVDHVAGLTSSSVLSYTEALHEVVLSAYWGDGEFIVEDELKHPETKANEVKRANGKVTLFLGGGKVVRNNKYYGLGVGEVLKVKNVFVHNNEIEDFLKYKINQKDDKHDYQMTTSLINSKLGSRVNVEVIPNKKYNGVLKSGSGWLGYIVGKKINYDISRDYKFDYSINVNKADDWTPERFKWGDKWDSGKVWND